MLEETRDRYQRQIILPEVGLEGQEKLLNAAVLVVGAGGLGCPVLQYLAAAGVGVLGIVDFDVVSLSNLQRQVLYQTQDIGAYKTLVAAERLKQLNPNCQINTYMTDLNSKNSVSIVADYDIVVDCSDNMGTRYLINDTCLLLNKPMVYAGLHKFQGQVSVFNYSKDANSKGVSYRCLFSKSADQSHIPSCEEAGILGVMPGIIGVVQALQVLKIILDLPGILDGSIWLIDALSMNTQTISLKRNEIQINNAPSTFQELQDNDYEIYCAMKTNSITPLELQNILAQISDLQIIDVRNLDEHEHQNFFKAKCIPLPELTGRIDEINTEKITVLYCASGKRSAAAWQKIQPLFTESKVYDLKGGIQNWLHFLSKKP